jgi:hypothetical protein
MGANYRKEASPAPPTSSLCNGNGTKMNGDASSVEDMDIN